MKTETVNTNFVVTRNREVPYHADSKVKVAQISLHPELQTEEDAPNRKAWVASPEGEIQMASLNPEAFRNWPIGTKVTVSMVAQLMEPQPVETTEA